LTDNGPGLLRRLVTRIRRIPPVLLLVLAAGVAALMVWGSVEAYRTYQFVQHDNEFCLSCHLMVDPYERFARSEHAELGCKSCHRPTLVTRSTMALTQILENPDSLSAHAEVSSAVCIECHVDGDPEQWSNIAASAGHRVHLESEDPSIAELECVQCHSTSVHEFAATEQTCGQAGCHENQRIQLGRMGALTIHCASCHTFNAVVEAASPDSAHLALQPQREECLSCHAMRERLTSFPLAADDPHDGMCASCHDPHAQTEPSQAYETCATCHTQADTLTPFHRGLAPGILESCSRCHSAHTFHAEGRECVACHTDPAHPERVTQPAQNPHPRPLSVLRSPVRVLAALFVPAPLAAQQSSVPGGMTFDHARHTDAECTACHSVTDRHGSVSITTVAECRSCHHTGSTAQPCSRCHRPADVSRQRYDVRRAYRPSVGTAENRTLPFAHQQHAGVECATCHIEGLALSAARVSCSTCHEEHHDPEHSCIACHEPPPATAHTRTAHLSCSGSGCHSAAPVTAAQRTRNLCLGCHQDLTDHQPGRRCSDCHALPDAQQASAPGGGDIHPVVLERQP
jgi:nitrate/TMAO reductase-like tetraheme cytochrome c subunit